MPRKPNPKPDDEKQAKRFIETAKALESDKTGETFDRVLGLIVPAPTSGAAEKQGPKPSRPRRADGCVNRS